MCHFTGFYIIITYTRGEECVLSVPLLWALFFCLSLDSGWMLGEWENTRKGRLMRVTVSFFITTPLSVRPQQFHRFAEGAEKLPYRMNLNRGEERKRTVPRICDYNIFGMYKRWRIIIITHKGTERNE